ncbi:MAG TPA: DUF4124 domain-containing protein [Arenimonas sp.]|uniref:DUF4124 domain-containing protein n=1 Tax=Arenimonas sp. TaxID=1872635 RepID=UPI002BF36335|nr:DUF4124 domain-containing protein [Arenimonas sp.]HMB57825.1 DUF4124 domain-containing protein [Arenimonas sp.]
MKTNRLILAMLVLLMAASAAQAQDKKKLYRWVDKQGKVHYDDALPPEAVDQARREFNASNGNSAGSVDRALTAEERAQAQASQDAAAKAAAVVQAQQMQESSMLVNYQTEADLRHAYDERITLLKQTIESTDIGLKGVRSSLADMLAQASETELDNRKVDAKRAGDIRELHVEMIKQQNIQSSRMSELASLDSEFQRVLARYRELRGQQLAGAPAAPVSAAAPAATK